MPGCVLRAFGRAFRPEDFLSASGLTPCKVWRFGEQSRRDGPPAAHAGFNVVTSDAEELSKQVEDTIAFLSHHRAELRRLREADGIDELVLDFAIAGRDVAAQYDRLPPELVGLAAQFSMSIELSHYWECKP